MKARRGTVSNPGKVSNPAQPRRLELAYRVSHDARQNASKRYCHRDRPDDERDQSF